MALSGRGEAATTGLKREQIYVTLKHTHNALHLSVTIVSGTHYFATCMLARYTGGNEVGADSNHSFCFLGHSLRYAAAILRWMHVLTCV